MKIEKMTKAQRALWKMEEKYRDLFSLETMEEYMDLWHDNFWGWPDFSESPDNKKLLRKKTIKFLKQFKNNSPKIEFIPHRVEIYGKTGIAFYIGIFKGKSKTGEKLKVTARLTHTWKKQNGKWVIIGGMSSTF